MARLDQILCSGLGVGLVAATLNGLRHAQAIGAEGQGAPIALDAGPAQSVRVRVGPDGDDRGADTDGRGADAGSLDADLAEYRRLLASLRQGEESGLADLRRIADRMCRDHARCDTAAVVEYYARIALADRARGLRRDDEVQALRSRVADARSRGLGQEEWQPLRDEIVDRLQALAQQATSEPDFVPAARALSLAAFLNAERIEGDAALTEDQREELLVAVDTDTRAALVGFERAGMLTPRLEALWTRGRLAVARGDSAAARAAYEDCLALAQRVGQDSWRENALGGLVDLAEDAGDLAGIARLLNEIASFRKPSQSWFLAQNQANLLLQSDEPRRAAEFLTENAPADPIARRQWHMMLGSAWLRAGEIDRAREEYAAEHGLRWGEDVVLAMASLDLKSGQTQRVIDQLSDPELRDKLSIPRRAQADGLIGEALLKLGRPDEAADVLSRALEAGGGYQARLASQRDPLAGATSVLGERVGLHALALYAEARARIGDGMEAARAIESWQMRSLRPAAEADLEAQDVASWAHDFELGLVTWVVGADSTVVAHVAPDGDALAITIPRGRRILEAAVRRLSEAAAAGDATGANRLLREIRAEMLPAPIAARIASLAGPRSGRLLLLPHGPLERLPFEMMEADERWVVVVLPGLPARRPGEPTAASALATWSLLGSPIDAAGRTLLPGAREELVSIAGILRADSSSVPRAGEASVAAAGADNGRVLRIDSRFDRAALLEALHGRAPLHVATHLKHGCGSMPGRLADVGLELSGEDVFCAREILEARPALPLVVLSACETAEGRFVDAEGLQGISRAFLESGTRNVVVTLRPVEDGAAREFAVEFHRQLRAGRRPSEAAAGARALLRSRGASVADWSAYRLLGRD